MLKMKHEHGISEKVGCIAHSIYGISRVVGDVVRDDVLVVAMLEVGLSFGQIEEVKALPVELCVVSTCRGHEPSNVNAMDVRDSQYHSLTWHNEKPKHLQL
jgi:hypothetical protein